jgi:GTP diphosphokinase / guanosine-3',5'-bis(diphosphate) 3'-diphosphatase
MKIFIEGEGEDLEKKAHEFAKIKHMGQKRSNGTPYITHPERVADYVEKFKKSHMLHQLKASAYLHDTLEDTDTTYEELEKEFGKLVASLVNELTSNKEKSKEIGKAKYLADKLSDELTDWALVLKLCDRRDNIDDLNTAKNPSFRKRYKEETEFILKELKQRRKLSPTQNELVKDIYEKLSKIRLDDGK